MKGGQSMPTSKNSPLVRTAIIGGSGVYQMEGLKVKKTFFPITPFGRPSDPITIGEFQGMLCAFLPRHGAGHRYLPSEIPQRANFYALKLLGVEFVVALSACGSLKEELAPRHMVVPDQIIDLTKTRPSTFFGEGLVAHVAFGQPFSPTLSKLLASAARKAGAQIQEGGTYLCIEGPAFSTQAESRRYRSQEADVIGMTAIPEAKLAREAEMSYALLAMVTDYDSWKENEEVTAQKVLENMQANVQMAKKIVAQILPALKDAPNDCSESLRGALFTDPTVIKPAVKKKLFPLIHKYIK
jgi:5'-methylthioadenosine phosphorylase